MSRSKSITVPKNGTQPALCQSPIDTMISGAASPAQQFRNTIKCPTSFSLDKELVAKFKAHCATEHKSMSSIIEKLMQEYIASGINRQA